MQSFPWRSLLWLNMPMYLSRGHNAVLTVIDGHAKAPNGKHDCAGCAEKVELAQAGDVGKLRDNELDGAKNGNPGLQGDAAGLQQRTIIRCALRVVQPVDGLQCKGPFKSLTFTDEYV